MPHRGLREEAAPGRPEAHRAVPRPPPHDCDPAAQDRHAPRRGAEAGRSQRPEDTTEIYGHLVAEDAREHLERLSFSPLPAALAGDEAQKREPATEALPLVVNDAPRAVESVPSNDVSRRGAPVVREGSEGKSETPEATGFLQQPRGFPPVGETGFEPATPWSRTKCSTRLSHSPVFRRRPTYRMEPPVSTQLPRRHADQTNRARKS